MYMEVEKVWEALRTVIDPELGVNIVDLGLVYDVDMTEKAQVNVEMTLTTPACPLSAYFEREIPSKVQTAIPDVEDVKVHIVWQPPWEPSMMSPDGRKQLGWGE